MSDLERQWDQLPVGPAPVEAILAAGRDEDAVPAASSVSARRRRRRVIVVAAAVGGLAASFVAGGLVLGRDEVQPVAESAGGSRTASGPTDGSGASADELQSAGGLARPAFRGELPAADSCGDLLDSYRDRAGDLLDGPVVNYYAFRRESLDDSRSNLPLPLAAAGVGPMTQAAVPSETGTNVQEAGVDEPDVVKTNGELLVRLREAELTTYDVSGERVRELGSLDLGDLHDGELLLSGDTVVVVGNDGSRAASLSYSYGRYAYDDGYGYAVPEQTRVMTVGIADPARPELRTTVDYDAALETARQHGDVVRLVLRKGVPDLGLRYGGPRAQEADERRVAESTLDDWLPQVAVDGGAEQRLLDCRRVAVPRADVGLATMAVVGFTAEEPGAPAATPDSIGVAGDAPMAYESTDHLYLAGAEADYRSGTTHLYGFALAGRGATYLGAGEVEGTLRDRWSMDEYDGVLRLALGRSAETGPWSSIVTLEPRRDELAEIGRVDRIGVREDLEAVRWFDGLALVVTFRQVDPLHAVDLTDPARPRLLGELEVPGFSSYLHPLGPRRVIGVGQGPQPDGGWGAQAGLFDVTDVTSPLQYDVVSYGSGAHARVEDDTRQFTWLPEQRIALTVLTRGSAVYVSRLQLGGGRMRNEETLVERGRDAAVVRLVPITDTPDGGRTVLVTGEDVRFFDVS